MKKRFGFIPRSAATIITAALVAALFAGGSAFAIKALTKKQAKKIFVTKTDANNTFAKKSEVLKPSSSGVAGATTGRDLGPSYLDLASTQVTTNGGRVLATANISLRNTTGTTAQVECFLRVDGANVDTWVVTVGPTGASPADANRRPVYSLVGGSGNLAAGTHTVLMRCGNAAATTGVIEDSAHLIAWNA